MRHLKLLMLSSLYIYSSLLTATSNELSHKGTAEEMNKAKEYNVSIGQKRLFSSPTPSFRPVEDTAAFAYVLMSEYEEGIEDVATLRQTIAENLPENVKLVILADADDEDVVRKKYLQWITKDRLIIAVDEYTRNGFWARDSFPVPVYDDSTKKTTLIAAQYFRHFSSWDSIAKSVKAPLEKRNFYFVGGNLLADEEGNCFSVDSERLFSVTAEELTNSYGCKSVHLMPYVKGIGDVDEVLKPLPGKKMLTNIESYREELESLGYKVIMLPEAAGEYRTYANTLIVGKKVFMPTYEEAEDEMAAKVYEDLGYQVYPVPSKELSDSFYGSIHCQTMAYPPINLKQLLLSMHMRIAADKRERA